MEDAPKRQVGQQQYGRSPGSWLMDTPYAALTYDATGCCWHIMCSVATCMLDSCMKVACLLWADVSTSIDWTSCLAHLAMPGEIFVAVK